MADAARPPTFVQIRPPATPASAWRKFGVASAGVALVVGIGWVFHRVTDKQDAPALSQVVPTTRSAAPPAQPVAVDLYAELERRAIDTAASAPAWTRESLMDRVSPFVPSISAADAPPAEAPDAAQNGPREVSVRLGKGETIASALQKLGLASETVAGVISALTAHVSLKRLPSGLGMTVQIRPAGAAGAKPILEILTLHLKGHQSITVERDAKGKYAVDQRGRSSRK